MFGVVVVNTDDGDDTDVNSEVAGFVAVPAVHGPVKIVVVVCCC